MAHPKNEILLINTKEQTADTPSIIGESQKHYAKLKKPDSKG